MGRPPLPSIRETHRPNAVFSAWPASSNQDAYVLSDPGFFYTGAVLYRQKPVYYKKYFLENPANKNCFVTGEKDHTICFHCGVALKDWKVTDSAWRDMQYGVRNVFTHYI